MREISVLAARAGRDGAKKERKIDLSAGGEEKVGGGERSRGGPKGEKKTGFAIFENFCAFSKLENKKEKKGERERERERNAK